MKLPFKKPLVPAGRQRRAYEGRAQVFSYHALRSQELGAAGRKLFRDTINHETAARAKRYWVQRFGILAIIIVLSVCTVNVLLLSSDPIIMPADPEQTYFLHSKATYQQAAAKLLSGSLLNGNKLTVNTTEVSNSLKLQFPELASVSVKLPLVGHRPLLYLVPTKPAVVLSARFGKPYVVDEKGRALTSASHLEGVDIGNLPRVKDDSGRLVRVGQQVISGDTVAFIEAVIYQVRAKHLEVSTFVLPMGKSELDMYLDGQSYFVKFNLADSTPEGQVGTFLAARQKLAGQGLTPAHYMDVRVAGRAYYQ